MCCNLSFDGLVRYCETELPAEKRIADAVLRRFLEDPLYADSEGRMTLSGLVWYDDTQQVYRRLTPILLHRFRHLVDDGAQTGASLPKWFRVLDLNGDGFLDWQDLQFFVKMKCEQLGAEEGVHHMVPFKTVWLQFMDIVPRLRSEGRVPANDPGLQSAGGLLFDTFCSADPRLPAWKGYC